MKYIITLILSFLIIGKSFAETEKNIYEKKRERKKIKNISLGVSGKKIYGADNLGNYYAINMNDGEIVCIKCLIDKGDTDNL